MTGWSVLSFSLVFVIDSISATIQSSAWIQQNDLRDRVFADSSFTTTTDGVTQCTATCFLVPRCGTVTYNSRSKLCKGYRTFFTAADSFVSDPGSALYELDHVQGGSYVYNNTLRLWFSLKTDLQTHEGAIQQCLLDNGNLVAVETVEKLEAAAIILREYYKETDMPEVWTDGYDESHTNVYTLRNGNPVPMTSELWCPGEPNHVDSEYCVGFHFCYRLNDWPCDRQMIYICEYMY